MKLTLSKPHIHKKKLKIELVLTPEPTDPIYPLYYASVPVKTTYPGKRNPNGSVVSLIDYNVWKKSLPRIWQHNPCLYTFVTIPSNITWKMLRDYIGDIFTPNTVATIENSIVQSNSADLIAVLMDKKTLLGFEDVTGADEVALQAEITRKLKNFKTITLEKGDTEIVIPQSLDVGSAAIDRGDVFPNNYTIVEAANPANESAACTTIELWSQDNESTNGDAGSFNVGGSGGDTLDCADSESLGTWSGGSKVTKSGLDIDFASGEWIGIFATDADMELEWSGENGWYDWGDEIPCTDNLFDRTTLTLSCYGTGAAAGWGGEYCGVSIDATDGFDGVTADEITGV